MSLSKIVIRPDASGYGLTEGLSTMSAQLDGGKPRFGKNLKNMTARLNAQWTTDRAGYKYLRAFYNTATLKGAKPFLIDLIVDGAALTEHTVFIVPGSMKLTSIQGLKHVVTATLEVAP